VAGGLQATFSFMKVFFCGIAEVHRNMGNVTFWPVLTVPSGARVAILS
jgi:hypothetical protein